METKQKKSGLLMAVCRTVAQAREWLQKCEWNLKFEVKNEN
jgi:hypothetical protein